MHTTLCRILTSDGLYLDGVLSRPLETVRNQLPVDAFLLIHGTGSNFYAPGVLESFTRSALEAGVSVLRINTRGHGGISSIPTERTSHRGGAAYEIISECRFDLEAWLDYLADRGFQKVVLVGHSMGAVKAVYAQAHQPHKVVTAVIALSPPRFCHANFLSHPKSRPFRDDLHRAEQLVSEGRGEELISVMQPLPLLLTASSFLAKYGPHDNYDVARHLPRLLVPAFVLIGSESVATSPAFDGLPRILEELSASHRSLSYHLVDGADVNYRSCPNTPFQLAASWLTRTLQ